MIRLEYNGCEVKVKFYHKTLNALEVECVTGISVDSPRRCTYAQIEIGHNKRVYQGIAVCHSLDNFCKATGRKKALEDAIFSLNKELRKVVWEAYGQQIGF